MNRIFNLAVFLTAVLPLNAQTVDIESYMHNVAMYNTAYMAEKYNIQIAEANLEAAKVFNDPEISVDYGNNQDWNLMMGQSVEVGLSYNPDISGVRKARMNVARTQKELAEASVAAYFSTLRFEASQAWAEAWRLKKECQVLEESVADMDLIAAIDSIRFLAGDIGRSDAMQSRLEARTLMGDLASAKAEYANALRAISVLSGGMAVDDISDANLPQMEIPYSLEQLCEMAQENRADLKAAQISCSLSEDNLNLVKASRSFELGINLGYSYNTEVRNEIAPAPLFHGLTVGVSVPLKFSSFNKGEVAAANNEILQNRKYYQAASEQIRMETAQAYNSFVAADQIQEHYDSDLLDEADQIMKSCKEGYVKGGCSLLELLAAQQTYRDVMKAYVEACCNRYVCAARLRQVMDN